jgi:hypothetical protein
VVKLVKALKLGQSSSFLLLSLLVSLLFIIHAAFSLLQSYKVGNDELIGRLA